MGSIVGSAPMIMEARTDRTRPLETGQQETSPTTLMPMITVTRMTKPLLAGLAALALGAALAPSTASASVAPVPRAVATCAEGGRCSVGDVGPGGGKIIYVNREIRILNINSAAENYLTITTSAPHNLVTGDRIYITGAVPADLNVASGTIDSIVSPTEFSLTTQLDLRAYTYSSGGVIPAASGGWNYLQAAPQGWYKGFGGVNDPLVTVPKYSNLAANLLDWRVGAGDANTKLLKRQTQNTGQDDPFDLLATLNSEWYLPSHMEIWAMYKALAQTSTSAAAQGLSEGVYFSSSAGNYSADLGHLWYVANFELNRIDNPAVDLGVSFGFDGGYVRPIRKLWLHTAQTNVAVAKTLGIGARLQIASVTKEGTPVKIRVLNGSACTIAAPVKQNRKTFFTLTGSKKAGTCSLRITAPKTYKYWALDQTKTITVR